MKSITLLLLLLVLLFTACKSETEVSGDVFVVTQGQDNKKLGLVPIAVYKADDILFKVDRNETKRKSALEDAEKELTDCAKYSGPTPSYYDEYKYKRLGMECEASARNLVDLVPASYFGELGTPIAIATTDADGKFSLKIPKAGKYVIAATSNRTVTGERTEAYFWLVPVEAKGAPMKVTMSNNNLVKGDVPPSAYIQGTK